MRHSISLVLTLSLIVSCGVFGDADEEPPPAGQSPVANPGPGTPAPPLDGTPKEDQINEKYGVFVVPNAAPDGDGTRAKPFATIAAGLEGAIAQSKRVYVCAGTFNESVKVANGISMVGGLDCSKPTWPPSTERTRVISPTSPAITADSISAATRIESFEIVAPDGTEQSPTSIGLRAKDAGALVVAKSRIVAGKGKDGAAGTDAAQLVLAAGANGTSSSGEQSGQPNQFAFGLMYREGEAGGLAACTGAPGFQPSPGGKGGKGASHDTETKSPPTGVSGQYWRLYCRPAGAACVQDWIKTAGEAKTPTVGTAGADGASASTPGTLNVDGYTPRDGTAGTNGGVGSGGSGGAGGDLTGYAGAQYLYGYGATGPGGGAGGCPGLAGTAGKGGGASIGAFLVSSKDLTFDATEVTACAGGAGGKGAFGSNPTSGGAAGTALGTASAAQAGGAGGRSGVSGSGAGGPSYGIAATLGDARLENGATAKSAAGGAGVAEEAKNDALGNPKTLPASSAGDSKDQISF